MFVEEMRLQNERYERGGHEGPTGVVEGKLSHCCAVKSAPFPQTTLASISLIHKYIYIYTEHVCLIVPIPIPNCFNYKNKIKSYFYILNIFVRIQLKLLNYVYQ